MKRWCILFLVVMALAAGVILSCSKTTIIGMREEPEEVYIPRTKADSTETEDTSRIPISFDVSVEGWKEVERE